MATQSSEPRMQTSNTPKQATHVTGEISAKNFATTQTVREFPLGKVELVDFNGATVGRVTLQPGWRWSTSVKPIVQTASCEAPHFQYHAAGILRIRMDDGKEIECKPGDVSLIPPGHDAWVVGNEPVILVDFQGMVDYAKKPGATHQH